MSKLVITEVHGKVGHISISRPETLLTLNLERIKSAPKPAFRNC